MTENN